MKQFVTTGGDAGFRKTKFLALLAASSILAGWTSQAFADDAEIARLQAEIHRVEARQQEEISALRAEIHHLRHTGGPLYVTKGEPAPGWGPHVIETTKSGVHFGFADLDEQNTVELTGRLHIDTGGYLNYQPGPGLRVVNGHPALASGINIRRARIGVQGIFLGDWAYGLIYDMGGTTDGFAGAYSSQTGVLTSGGITSGIENAFITYNGLYKHGGPIPVAFDLGVIDVPWTLDEPMGSNDIMFMERSSSQVIATLFGGGDSRTAIGFRSNNDRYWVGGYITGPTTGAQNNVTGNGLGAAVSSTVPAGGTSTSAFGIGPVGLGPQFAGLFRATYQLYQDKATNASIHIGFNGAYTFEPRTCTTSANSANAATAAGTPYYCNVSGLDLADRPELRIDPTQFVNADISAHAAQVLGAEAAASYENAFVQAEYYHYIVDTTNAFNDSNGPVVGFNGGYVQGSYTFGGRRYYKPTTGAYSGVIPDRPFVLGTDGWGALELAGRFSIVDLNSFAPGYVGFGASSATNHSYILGGEQVAAGAGLNWYPNGNMKFMLDYEHVQEYVPNYGSATGAALPTPSAAGNKDATIDWIAARSEFFF
jgi:phosphate-selective porin OprO and OprP